MNREIKFRGKQISWEYGGYSNAFGEHQIINDNGSFTVDEKTVGQQFEVRDTKVFEGDIVMISHWYSRTFFNYDEPFLVCFDGSQVYFKQNHKYLWLSSMQGKLSIEVIGNIHENQDLLK